MTPRPTRDPDAAHRRHERRVLLGLAAVVLVFMAIMSLAGTSDEPLALVPLLALLVPLLTGRYVGEELLARLRSALERPHPVRRTASRWPTRYLDGVRPLLAAPAMASRPPPA